MASLSNEGLTTPSLIEMLRTTLRRLEENEEIDPADPALLELKNSILRAIGEMELKKMSRSKVA